MDLSHRKTVYEMIPGRQDQVRKSFTDYYGNTFEQGQLLRFKERHFLPYESGQRGPAGSAWWKTSSGSVPWRSA